MTHARSFLTAFFFAALCCVAPAKAEATTATLVVLSGPVAPMQVSFTAPKTVTGAEYYEVSVVNAFPFGCTGQGRVTVAQAAAGELVHVVIPVATSSSWCSGSWTGEVALIRPLTGSAVCAPPQLAPLLPGDAVQRDPCREVKPLTTVAFNAKGVVPVPAAGEFTGRVGRSDYSLTMARDLVAKQLSWEWTADCTNPAVFKRFSRETQDAASAVQNGTLAVRGSYVVKQTLNGAKLTSRVSAIARYRVLSKRVLKGATRNVVVTRRAGKIVNQCDTGPIEFTLRH